MFVKKCTLNDNIKLFNFREMQHATHCTIGPKYMWSHIAYKIKMNYFSRCFPQFQVIFGIFLKIFVQQSSKIKIWLFKVWTHCAFKDHTVSSARFSGSLNKKKYYYNKVSFKKLDLVHCMHSKGLFDICTFYISMH